MSGCAEGRKILPGGAASLVAIVFVGISLSTEPPKGQSSAAKRFVQETFRIGVPIRKVLSLCQPFHHRGGTDRWSGLAGSEHAEQGGQGCFRLGRVRGSWATPAMEVCFPVDSYIDDFPLPRWDGPR